MSGSNANPEGTLFGYWMALIGVAMLSTGLLGPPLASCYLRRPILDGIYQVGGLLLCITTGIPLRGHVRRLLKAHRFWAGVLIGSLAIPIGFAVMAVHWVFGLLVQFLFVN